MSITWTRNQWKNQVAFWLWCLTDIEYRHCYERAIGLSRGRAGWPCFWEKPLAAAEDEAQFIELVQAIDGGTRRAIDMGTLQEVDDTDWFFTGGCETVPNSLIEIADSVVDAVDKACGVPEHMRPPFMGNPSELAPVTRESQHDEVFAGYKPVPLAEAQMPDLVIGANDDGSIVCNCAICQGRDRDAVIYSVPHPNPVGCVCGQLCDDQGVPAAQHGGNRTWLS